LEAIDEDTWRSKAGQFHDRRRSELEERSERKLLELQAGSGDVLAELRWSDVETSIREGCEELGRDQVNLPQIQEARLAAGEIAVPDERAGLSVAFDAMAFDQQDPILRRFVLKW
jgi:hypothetical protein